MIYHLFPSNVLIKDTDLTEQQLDELNVAIQAIFASHQALTGSHVESGEEVLTLQ